MGVPITRHLCTCLLKDVQYSQLQQILDIRLSKIHEETILMEFLGYHKAFFILKKAITCYFISEDILKQGPELNKKNIANFLFNSFLYNAQTSGNIAPEDASLSLTLSSCNFES